MKQFVLTFIVPFWVWVLVFGIFDYDSGAVALWFFFGLPTLVLISMAILEALFGWEPEDMRDDWPHAKSMLREAA